MQPGWLAVVLAAVALGVASDPARVDNTCRLTALPPELFDLILERCDHVPPVLAQLLLTGRALKPLLAPLLPWFRAMNGLHDDMKSEQLRESIRELAAALDRGDFGAERFVRLMSTTMALDLQDLVLDAPDLSGAERAELLTHLRRMKPRVLSVDEGSLSEISTEVLDCIRSEFQNHIMVEPESKLVAKWWTEKAAPLRALFPSTWLEMLPFRDDLAQPLAEDWSLAPFLIASVPALARLGLRLSAIDILRSDWNPGPHLLRQLYPYLQLYGLRDFFQQLIDDPDDTYLDFLFDRNTFSKFLDLFEIDDFVSELRQYAPAMQHIVTVLIVNDQHELVGELLRKPALSRPEFSAAVNLILVRMCNSAQRDKYLYYVPLFLSLSNLDRTTRMFPIESYPYVGTVADFVKCYIPHVRNMTKSESPSKNPTTARVYSKFVLGLQSKMMSMVCSISRYARCMQYKSA